MGSTIHPPYFPFLVQSLIPAADIAPDTLLAHKTMFFSQFLFATLTFLQLLSELKVDRVVQKTTELPSKTGIFCYSFRRGGFGNSQRSEWGGYAFRGGCC